MNELSPQYDPQAVESAITERWNAANCFHAEPADAGDPYSICIPPPNVTAALHLGHALNNTLQDVLTRVARMRGMNACWLPGTDHAGIATQTVVDKRLQAEGEKALKEYKLLEAEGGNGREQFLEKVTAWKDEYEARITQQLKDMGCSCDWERQAFTMDQPRAAAVREAFFRLFKDGLIYRGKRLVNWDPVSQTALADDEVEMEDVDGHFYYMKYPVCSASGEATGEFVTVATTRPETMLGDTGVAVNPDDKPRANFIGQFVKLPIVGRIIPIVGDDYVVIPDADSSDAKARMASGFLKVTPAHDQNDYEIGQRHKEAIEDCVGTGRWVINIMAPDASISTSHGWDDASPECEPFVGLSREDARRAIVRWFKAADLLEDQKPYKHAVGHSYRSHVPVEPYYSDQWYLKVTDDRLAGATLRAMVPEQRKAGTECSWTNEHPFESGSEVPSTSRDREGADPSLTSTKKKSYFITFTTYGTHLHGSEDGSVDRDHNVVNTPYLDESDGRTELNRDNMKAGEQRLDDQQRPMVRDTILEVCRHRGWSPSAINVRTTHVHVVLEAGDTPEKVMNDLKSYATRRLREANLFEDEGSLWTRHGSTRYLNDDASRSGARRYVLDEQGDDLGGVWDAKAAEEADAKGPLPHGRGSFKADKPDTGLTFYPERYAKTFQNWHENIRDWCISRQLWWGHRIPVWSIEVLPEDEERFIHENTDSYMASVVMNGIGYVCLGGEDGAAIEAMEEAGFKQDPDVLDTWFSSALWPMSTLGWPEQTPDLAKWNPSSVLCTAREIITLWVSRMVMFNLYFEKQLPFKDVFIHAMIQDGHGQKMSKSLGNGVDPLDIIESHGSDAMRYTLTAMTTQTQDVRMPVDLIDPHSGDTFTPKFVTGPGGVKVAAPEQDSPSAKGKKMASSYGVAAGLVKPTDDLPAAKNTSEKFDLGQRLANKLWNATRFALSILTDETPTKSDELTLADRWILGRLAETVESANASLAQYRFAEFATGLYDFFWRDLCDWYLEAIKPTVRGNLAQRRTLAACIDATLRLLHPVMPFITERLWESVNEAVPGDRSVDGLALTSSDLLATAAWPKADAQKLIDAEASADFAFVQSIVSAIREIRAQHKVAPSATVVVSSRAPAEVLNRMVKYRPIAEALARYESAEVGPDVTAPPNAATAIVGDVTLYVHDVVDAAAETQRLTKKKDELQKKVANFEKRLANEKYVNSAPAKLVQETRDQFAAAARELEAVEAQLSDIA